MLAMKTSEWSSIASSLAKVALELLSCDWDAEEGRGRPATDEAGDQPPKLPMRDPKRPSEREDESDEMVECARAEGEMGAILEAYCWPEYLRECGTMRSLGRGEDGRRKCCCDDFGGGA